MYVIVNKTTGVVWHYNALNGAREELGPNAYGIINEIELPRINDLIGVEVVKEITASDLLSALQSQTKKNYPAPLMTRGKVLFFWGKEPEEFALWAYHVAVTLASNGYSVHILTQDEIPNLAEDYKVNGHLTWECNRFSAYDSFDYVLTVPSAIIEAETVALAESLPLYLLTTKESKNKTVRSLITPSMEVTKSFEKKGLEDVRTIPSIVSEGANFISEKPSDYIIAMGADSVGFFNHLRNVEEPFSVHVCGNGQIQGDAQHPIVVQQLAETKERLKWLAKAKAIFVLSYQPIDFIIREALAVGTPVFVPNIFEFEQEFGKRISYFNNPITALEQVKDIPRKRFPEYVGCNIEINLRSKTKPSPTSSVMIFWGPLIEKGGGISYMLQMMREASEKGFSVFYIGSSGSREFVSEFLCGHNKKR